MPEIEKQISHAPKLPNCQKCGKPLEEHFAIPGAPGGLECPENNPQEQNKIYPYIDTRASASEGLPQTKPQEQEEWIEKFREKLWGYFHKKVEQEEIESFIRSLLQTQRAEAKEEEKLRIDNLISKKLLEFANTFLDKRQNGWEWLLKLRESLNE